MSKDGFLGFGSVEALKAFNQSIIDEFRANAGQCGGRFEGNPMLLLTMRGAQTNRWLTTPLSYCADGDDCIVMASAGGSSKHPMWFFNLLANPLVMIERGSETYRALADVLSGQNRSRAFEKMIAALPRFKDYQDQVVRAIPVIRLSRCES